MEIGGFIKTSLLDYPEKVAAVIFTQGCNFRCPYCHNRGLWGQTNNTRLQQYVIQYLATHRHFLDGVVITGGEPTLQSDLLQFLDVIKQLGFLVKLDTNGSRPDVLYEVLKHRFVDYVAMDVKTVLDTAKYSAVTGILVGKEQLTMIASSIDSILASGVEYEFRTTVCRTFISTDDVHHLLTTTLQECRRYCLQMCRSHQFHHCQSYRHEEFEFLRYRISLGVELILR